MKKLLLLALCIANCALCINLKAQETSYPEVSTIEELTAALGTQDSVIVHFKNLQPITIIDGLFSYNYMSDKTTIINFPYALPSHFDAIGTYKIGSFTINSITNILSFHNLFAAGQYYFTSSQPDNDYEFKLDAPITITAIEGDNYFVQFKDITNITTESMIYITGQYDLKIGDQIKIDKITCNPKYGNYDTEKQKVTIKSQLFTTGSESIKIIKRAQKFKHYSLENDNLANRTTAPVVLPIDGKIEVNNNKIFYTKDTIAIEIKSNTIDLNSYNGQIITDQLIKGVVNFQNTNDDANYVIINEISPIPAIKTIEEWIDMAKSDFGYGILDTSIIVTAKTPENGLKIKLFAEDSTGAICLDYQFTEKPYVISVDTNDMITGIKGNLQLFTESGMPMAPTIALVAADTADLNVVGKGTPIKPINVTIAELNEDEKNILTNYAVARKYANRLIKLNGVSYGGKEIMLKKILPLVQGEDTLKFYRNTLTATYYQSFTAQKKPMSITGIADFRTINGGNLYSIYPRSTEDIITDFLTPPTFTPSAGTYEKEVNVTIKSFDQTVFAIYYTLDGSDPIEDGEEYNGEPITLTETTTIKAVALYDVDKENPYSEITEATYVIVDKIYTKPEAPIFTPESGLYTDAIEVSISCPSEENVIILYDLFGLEPDLTSSPRFDGEPIKLAETTTISAVAVLVDENNNPILNPDKKPYISEQSIVTYIINIQPTNVDNISVTAVVYSKDKMLYIDTNIGNHIEVYTINGQNIYNATATTNTTAINALNNDIVIVRINGKAIKVAVK